MSEPRLQVEIKVEAEDEEDNWSEDEDEDEDEDEEEEEEEEDGDGMQFVMDGDNGTEAGQQAGDEKAVDVMAEKLDNMLLLVFHYLRETFKEEDVVPTRPILPTLLCCKRG